MWQSVQEYFWLMLASARSYLALGPVAVDRALQFFFVGYKNWASTHGPGRQRVVWTIAISGIIWVQFWAFHAEYEKQGETARLAQQRLESIQGTDGNGGLQHDVTDLHRQLDAKDKELQAVNASKVQIKYVQVPPPAVTVHVDAAGAYVQPHLSDTQKVKLKAALQPLLPDFGKKPFMVFISNFERSSIYGSEFMRALKGAGVDAYGPQLAGADKEGDRGVLVGLRDPEHPSELSKRFVAALESTGIEVKTTRWGYVDEPIPVQPDQLDFDLFIVE
jgi:hypothetical protein